MRHGTTDDLGTWEIRNLSAVDETGEYAQRNEQIGAESGREAEVGGPNMSDDDGERRIAPGPGRAKGRPCVDELRGGNHERADELAGHVTETREGNGASPKGS